MDSIVTDPPYLIGFMGKEFDSQHLAFVERRSNRRAGSFEGAVGNHNPCNAADAARTRRSEAVKAQAWHEEWAREALRVLKPGGHLLAFGFPRGYHRLACAIEDAGFEVRDCIMWVYGSGMPKSLDVSKAIDKAAGAQRTRVVGAKPGHEAFIERTDAHSAGGRSDGWERPWRSDPDAVLRSHQVLAPATPEAELWEGWGTALKPAYEPIVVARKPLEGTVASNVSEHGTGAINIGAGRVGEKGAQGEAAGLAAEGSSSSAPQGRWPANVILDDEAGELLDAQCAIGEGSGGLGDAVGPSRFFYCPKASRAERDEGLEAGERNHHPTVKPARLMAYLCRLVTPPGGTILDPFAGSASTGLGAQEGGFGFIGIELDAGYRAVGRRRLDARRRRLARRRRESGVTSA